MHSHGRAAGTEPSVQSFAIAPDHAAGVARAVAISPDMQLLATGWDDQVRVYRSAMSGEGHLFYLLDDATGDVTSVSFTGDSHTGVIHRRRRRQFLASGSRDGSVRVYDMDPPERAANSSDAAARGGILAVCIFVAMLGF